MLSVDEKAHTLGGKIMKRIIALMLLILGLSSGCAARGILTMPDERIWIVVGKNDVYRCAEVKKRGIPRPVCIRAAWR